ncbi:MAG: glycosyltransferase [Actinomycetia bacterium]|nr:glycosyltransferase [Actinomycetes bacterium]MCP4958622.1 glycosyltransferase [Actinomycetes bacterium]
MNVYVRELVTSLAHQGVRCEVFTRRVDDSQPDVIEVEPGFRLHHITAGGYELAKEDLPAIVGTFTDEMLRILEVNPVDGLHANYWLSADVGHRLKHELDIPLAVTFHTLGAVKRASGDDEPQFRINTEQSIIGCSDVVFASCDTEALQLIEHYEAARGRIELVAPGVDHAFFSPGQRWAARQALGLPTDRRLALFAGRLQPLKGVDLAIEAVAVSTSRPDLVVVGGPSGSSGADYVEYLQKRAADLGVADRIHWFDPQPHHLLSSFYRAVDVCVVPSRSESFGLVALEASACGTPVIAADVGGLGTIVVDGATGLLVQERTPAAFAAALDTVLVGSKSLSMGGCAYEHSLGFTWGSAAAAVTEVFDRLRTRELVSCS